MFRLALIIGLTIAATPALAGTTGHDFCTVMQQQHVACTKEAAAKDSTGAAIGRCPHAMEAEGIAFDNAMKQATGSLRPEMQAANSQWLSIVMGIKPHASESLDDYINRTRGAIHDIVTECERLRTLD